MPSVHVGRCDPCCPYGDYPEPPVSYCFCDGIKRMRLKLSGLGSASGECDDDTTCDNGYAPTGVALHIHSVWKMFLSSLNGSYETSDVFTTGFGVAGRFIIGDCGNYSDPGVKIGECQYHYSGLGAGPFIEGDLEGGCSPCEPAIIRDYACTLIAGLECKPCDGDDAGKYRLSAFGVSMEHTIWKRWVNPFHPFSIDNSLPCSALDLVYGGEPTILDATTQLNNTCLTSICNGTARARDDVAIPYATVCCPGSVDMSLGAICEVTILT